MIAQAAARPFRLRLGRESAAVAGKKPRRWPVESTFIFVVALVGYLAFADIMIVQTHYMNDDAFSRVANADYVIATRNPHLGAIGFVWPPLPSMADLFFLFFLGHFFPFLLNYAFAGAVAAAFAGAGALTLINIGLRKAGVIMPVRYLVLIAWLLNPMLIVYSAQGMSEIFEIFFMIALALVFFRWCDTKSSRDLTVLGILAGLNALVHEESMTLSVMIGAGVLLCSFGRRVSWREIETRAMLFGIPFGLLFGGWIAAQAILLHDPLYFIHSVYANGAQAAANGGFGDAQLALSHTYSGAATYVLKQAVSIFPAAFILAILVIARLPFARNRRAGIVALSLGLPIPAVAIYELHAGQLALQLRYSMWVIGWAAVLGLYLVWDMRGSSRRVVPIVASVAMAGLLLASNLATFDLMDRPDGISQEYPLIVALESHAAMSDNNGVMPNVIDDGQRVAAAVVAADRDKGLIAMDTFGGFDIFVNAPDPHMFVVTSDYDFEAVASQPLVYHVEYFLVPAPSSNGALDRFNQLYPGLWSNGESWAQEVAYIGGHAGWKLFRITGPTGRG